MGKQVKILLPSVNETAAITLKPKTAALCFDRVWGTSDDVVSPSIRCWGGTQVELSGTGLAVDFNVKTNRAPISAMIGPEDKKLEMLRAGTDLGLASAFRRISKSFFGNHGTPLIPIFDFVKHRDQMYRQGNREVIITTLADLDIVDEEQLSWEQVMEFRADEEMRGKYKRLLRWLDKEMTGRSPSFIEDEIAQKFNDYQKALKKHGIRTIVGIVEEALDGKLIAGATAATGTLNLAGHPTLGFLVGAGIVIGKVMIKLIQVKLDYDDIERGPNSEVSWVYEAKKQLSK
ncbi:hypothetical protein KA005_33820 [bacterium]|nr:hypothetical protein [bacterium]